MTQRGIVGVLVALLVAGCGAVPWAERPPIVLEVIDQQVRGPEAREPREPIEVTVGTPGACWSRSRPSTFPPSR